MKCPICNSSTYISEHRNGYSISCNCSFYCNISTVGGEAPDHIRFNFDNFRSRFKLVDFMFYTVRYNQNKLIIKNNRRKIIYEQYITFDLEDIKNYPNYILSLLEKIKKNEQLQ
jgi:hypothetical protein